MLKFTTNVLPQIACFTSSSKGILFGDLGRTLPQAAEWPGAHHFTSCVSLAVLGCKMGGLGKIPQGTRVYCGICLLWAPHLQEEVLK